MEAKHNHKAAKQTQKKLIIASAIGGALIVIWWLLSVNIPPFHAFGGAMWFKNGVHYISDSQISDRIAQINAPAEEKIKGNIAKSTQPCDAIDSGFCKQSPDVYADKELVTPAVEYVPGTPDKKEIAGYCTACNDGTFSPSCAVGRGACSYHGGVAAYNVAQYITIPGTPEVPAKAAVHSYASQTYQNSPAYSKPATPSLNTIVNFAI